MPAIEAGTYAKDELEQFRDEVRNLFIKELTNEPPMN